MRRLWGAPLWAHAAALGLLLVALLPLMSPASSFTSDEGAYALQAKALNHGSWAYDYRAAPLDPLGRAFPVILSDGGPSGYFPYVRHPAYPVLLEAGALVVGRTVGLHLVNLLGVIGAAVAAWLLAGELDPRLRRPAFWLLAGGPVLVNGFIIWAHAPSAALGGFALFGAARIARRGVTTGVGVATAGAVVGGLLLRSEGLLLAVAMATTLAAVRFRLTRRPGSAAAAFGLVAGPAFLAALAERRWISAIIGGSYRGVAGQGGTASSFLVGRRSGAWHELLQAHFIDTAAGLPMLVALAVVVGLGFVALRRWAPGSSRTLTWAVTVATVLLAVRFVAHPHDPVTGLFPAWPLALLGLLLFRWRGAGPVAWLLGGTLVIFTFAVLATQYPEGGGLEWGGRYLSAAWVPLAVLAAAGLARAVDAVPPTGRLRAVALLTGFGLVTTVFALGTAGALRAREDGIVAALARHPAPVTVTTRMALPRLAWRADDRLTWMLTDDADLASLLHSLRAQGVTEVTVVTSPQVPLSALSDYPDVQEQHEPALAGDGMRMVVARA